MKNIKFALTVLVFLFCLTSLSLAQKDSLEVTPQSNEPPPEVGSKRSVSMKMEDPTQKELDDLNSRIDQLNIQLDLANSRLNDQILYIYFIAGIYIITVLIFIFDSFLKSKKSKAKATGIEIPSEYVKRADLEAKIVPLERELNEWKNKVKILINGHSTPNKFSGIGTETTPETTVSKDEDTNTSISPQHSKRARWSGEVLSRLKDSRNIFGNMKEYDIILDWFQRIERLPENIEDKKFLENLYNVIDNYYRWYQSVYKNSKGNRRYQKIIKEMNEISDLISKYLLESFGIKWVKIELFKTKFDENIHKAIRKHSDPRYPSGTILRIEKCGFNNIKTGKPVRLAEVEVNYRT